MQQSQGDISSELIKSNLLAFQHGSLQNYTDAEVGLTGIENQTAYKDFYTKQNLVWWKDADSNGVPDTDADGFILEEKSDLPELVNALKFDGVNQHALLNQSVIPYSNKGYFHVAFVLLDLSEKSYLFSIGHAATSNSIFNIGVDTTGYLQFYFRNIASQHSGIVLQHNGQDILLETGVLYTCTIVCDGTVWIPYLNGRKTSYREIIVGASQQGKWFDQINSHTAYNSWSNPPSITLGARNYAGTWYYSPCTIADFHLSDRVPTEREILEWHSNTLLRNPKAIQIPFAKPNFNKIIDNAGAYSLEELSGQGHQIDLVNFTTANLDDQDPAYSLTLIDDLR